MAITCRRAHTILCGRFSEWCHRFNTMQYVRSMMDPHRWGGVLLRTVFTSWLLLTKNRKTRLKHVCAQHLSFPSNHCARKVIPVIKNYLQFRAFNSLKWYVKCRVQKKLREACGDRKWIEKKTDEVVFKMKSICTQRKCMKMCTLYWKTKHLCRAMDILRSRHRLKNKIRLNLYAYKQIYVYTNTHSAFSHWFSMLKHLKHERISDQHQEQHMRMYQLRKFFSRLQHRIPVDLKIRRASEVASLQWSTIERQRCFVIWVDNVHQFIHEHRVKTLINNNFRKKNLKAGLVRLFQNMHHMQGLYQKELWILEFWEEVSRRRMFRFWCRQNRMRKAREVQENLFFKKRPFHHLQWIMRRLKRNTLVWSHRQMAERKHKASMYRMFWSLRKIVRFVTRRTEEDNILQSVTLLYKKNARLSTLRILHGNVQLGKTNRHYVESKLKMMLLWNAAKSLHNWHLVTRRLKREHIVKELNDATTLKSVVVRWRYAAGILKEKRTALEQIERSASGWRLKHTWSAWRLLFKVVRLYNDGQKKMALVCLKERASIQKRSKKAMRTTVCFLQKNVFQALRAFAAHQHRHKLTFCRRLVRSWKRFTLHCLKARVLAEASFSSRQQALKNQIFQEWAAVLEKKARKILMKEEHLKSVSKVFLQKLAAYKEKARKEREKMKTAEAHQAQTFFYLLLKAVKARGTVLKQNKMKYDKALAFRLGYLCSQARRMLLQQVTQIRSTKLQQLHIICVKTTSWNKWRKNQRHKHLHRLLQWASARLLSSGFLLWNKQCQRLQFMSNQRECLLKKTFFCINRYKCKQKQDQFLTETVSLLHTASSKRTTWKRWQILAFCSRNIKLQRKRLLQLSMKIWKTSWKEMQRARLKDQKMKKDEDQLRKVQTFIQHMTLSSFWHQWRGNFLQSTQLKAFIQKIALKRKEEAKIEEGQLKRTSWDAWVQHSPGLVPENVTKCLRVASLRRRHILKRWKKAIIVELHRRERLQVIVKAALRRQTLTAFAEALQVLCCWAKVSVYYDQSAVKRAIKRWNRKAKLKKRLKLANKLYSNHFLSTVFLHWWSYTAARTLNAQFKLR